MRKYVLENTAGSAADFVKLFAVAKILWKKILIEGFLLAGLALIS